MKYKSVLFIVIFANIFICQDVFSEPNIHFPTHCASNEFAYLNARMANSESDSRGYFLNKKNGNILSICADKDKEPFGKVFYRYGAIGKVEMEKIATRSDKFSIFSRSTSPHTGQNLMFFKSGQYEYCVFEATAQGSGIGLIVLKSRLQILNLFSGNEYGIDFQSGMIEINFGPARSPIFQYVEPLDDFQTPCDPRPAQ